MAPISLYFLNLKLTDLVLNKVMNILKNYEDQKILLILSSDHWYTLAEGRNTDNTNIFPILFFAKILNDNTSIKASKKTNAIYIQELIYRYLTKEISNHTQIEKFFEKKNNISNFLLKKKF